MKTIFTVLLLLCIGYTYTQQTVGIVDQTVVLEHLRKQDKWNHYIDSLSIAIEDSIQILKEDYSSFLLGIGCGYSSEKPSKLQETIDQKLKTLNDYVIQSLRTIKDLNDYLEHRISITYEKYLQAFCNDHNIQYLIKKEKAGQCVRYTNYTTALIKFIRNQNY